jgi:hypothetical protein
MREFFKSWLKLRSGLPFLQKVRDVFVTRYAPYDPALVGVWQRLSYPSLISELWHEATTHQSGGWMCLSSLPPRRPNRIRFRRSRWFPVLKPSVGRYGYGWEYGVAYRWLGLQLEIGRLSSAEEYYGYQPAEE